MIQEAYCSYEISKLLKEKGFDESSFAYYSEFDDWKTLRFWRKYARNPINTFYLCAPTHQMACAWLREVLHLHISVDVSPIYGKVKDEKGRITCGLLYWHYMASGEWMNDKYNPQQKAFVVSEKSYEKAVEAAIRYSLENLI